MGFEGQDEKQPFLQKPAQSDLAEVTQESQWSTGLFDCCAQPGGGALGCVSLLMPCVQYGVLAEQLPEGSTFLAGSFGGAAAAFFCLDVLAAMANCYIWPGINLLPTSALLHMRMRSHLRQKYAIKGCGFSDLCTTWWCGPCALAQETREVVLRGASEQRVAVGAAPGSAVAPSPPLRMVGNLLLPSPAAAVASGPPCAPVCAPMMGPIAGAIPATGIPMPSMPAVPHSHVATVTLMQGDQAKPAAAQ